MVAPVILSGMNLLTKGMGLAETILKRQTPSEAKKLGELKLKLIDLVTMRENEEEKIDPNDELIQESYKKEVKLHEKINVYMDLADSQQRSIDA